MAGYPITLTPDDNGTFLITCNALPEVTSFSETEAEAPAIARRAIEEALAARMAAGEDLPPLHPDVRRGRAFAGVRSLVQMKATLYQAMRDRGVNRAEMTRRLGWQRNSVDRLFQLGHHSRADQLDDAFIQLGWPSSIDAITDALEQQRATG